jgi:hypothetical protein
MSSSPIGKKGPTGVLWDRYETVSDLHPDPVVCEVYRSFDGTLEWKAYYSDLKKGAWFGFPEFSGAQLDSFGLRLRAADIDVMDIPIWEYPEQSPSIPAACPITSVRDIPSSASTPRRGAISARFR